MDRTGLIALIIGLVLCAAGAFAIWVFLPEFIAVVKGLLGILVLLFGLCLVLFGILVIND
jgi:hypothetical protein